MVYELLLLLIFRQEILFHPTIASSRVSKIRKCGKNWNVQHCNSKRHIAKGEII